MLFRCITLKSAVIAAILLFMLPPTARAVVLWSDLGATVVQETGPGADILGNGLERDGNSSDVLYFKFHVEPLSDVSTEEYFAAFELYEGETERLGVGNSLKAWAYSAFNTEETGEFNKVFGDIDLHSARPETSAPGVFLPYELPRRGIENTIVFRVQFIPGANDSVTVWLSPDLAPGASEATQRQSLVTRFRANCSFNQIRLRHGGGGGGWIFSEMEVATSFEDMVGGVGFGPTFGGRAEELSIRFWQREQGLPQSAVHALLQSSEGYLWLGLDESVTRFDGVRFVSFGVREGLRIGRAEFLAETPDGALWIGTQSEGLCRLMDGQFTTLGLEEGLPSRKITALKADPDGRLWVGTDAGLAVLIDGHPVRLESSPPQAPVEFIYKDAHGTMWVGLQGVGIFRFLENTFVPLDAPSVNDLLKDAHCFLDDRSGRIWVGAGDDYLLCQEGEEWRRYRIPRHLSQPCINTLAEDLEGTVWAGSVSEGLFTFQNGRLDSVNAANGLSDNFIESLAVDREGSVWVGTSSGLNRLTRRSFSVLSHHQGLGYGPVQGLAEIAPGIIWAARFNDGLYRWDGRTFSGLSSSTAGPSYKSFLTLMRSSDDRCWAGGTEGLFVFQDPSNSQVSDPKPVLEGKHVLAIYEDNKGNIWAGTQEGTIYRSSPGGFVEEPGLSQSAPVVALVQDADSALLVGTDGQGLARYGSGSDIRFRAQNGLMSDSVRTVYVDRRGIIWAGTAGGGLVRIEKLKPLAITMREGLPDNTITVILEDNSSRLWLGTPSGIAAVQKSDLDRIAKGEASMVYPQLYTRTDGLPSDRCMGGFSPAGLKVAPGNLWFPTQKGIVVMDPSRQLGQAPAVPIVIEQVLLDGKPVPRADDGSFQVAPGRKTIEFHYTGLSLTAPERIRFRYRLLGLDERWVDADARRAAFYGHIPPGRYQFEVTACNREGQWNPKATRLTFAVLPHLWQAWWFMMGAGLAGLGAVVFAVRLVEKKRTQRRLKELEQQRLIDLERTRIAQDLHDDLGSSLTRICLLGDLIKEEKNNPSQVAIHAAKISQSANHTVRSLEEIVWALRPRSDTLQGLLEYIIHFANELFQNTSTACRLDLPDILPEQPLPPEMRHNLFLIVKEALTNTVKHSMATEVVVKARIQEQRLEIEVRDNGRGFDKGAYGLLGRNGLSNMARRAEVMGAKLTVQSEPGRGTLVLVALHLPTPALKL